MIGQLRPSYVYNLNMYMKFLEQRNNYLKQIKVDNKNYGMIEVWNEKLSEYADKVFNYRQEFIKKIKEKINAVHSDITEQKEKIEIEYISDYVNKNQFINDLHKCEKIDIYRGYTTRGVHKDDFLIKINDKPVNVYGSQGQHRTAVLSLKICELKVIYDEIGEYPILLLDDFMSELDEKRRKSLIKNMKDIQVIITCTDKIDLEGLNYQTYSVINGKVKKD